MSKKQKLCEILCSLDSSDLFDERGHLIFLYGAIAVLVEFFEGLLEIFVLDILLVIHLRESVSDKSFGLLLIEEAISVLIILSPDVLNALVNDLVKLLTLCHVCLTFGFSGNKILSKDYNSFELSSIFNRLTH